MNNSLFTDFSVVTDKRVSDFSVVFNDASVKKDAVNDGDVRAEGTVLTDNGISQDTFRAYFCVSTKHASRLNGRRCIYGHVVGGKRVFKSSSKTSRRCNLTVVHL